MDFSALLASLGLNSQEYPTDKIPEDKAKVEFIQKMKQLESSGGQNTNHPWVQSGLHKGYRGIGETAFMPLTIKEFANRSGDEDLKKLANLDQMGMEIAMKNNPELEKKLQDVMYDRLKSQMSGDPDKMAYGWQYGHNLKGKEVTPETLENSERVKKFKELKGNSMTDEQMKALKARLEGEKGALTENEAKPKMDFSKLSDVIGRNKSNDPNFSQYVQEKSQDVLAQGDENIKRKQELEDRYIEGIKSGQFDSDASKQLAEMQVGQMAMGSINPLKTALPQAEKIVIGSGKPFRLSTGVKSEFSQPVHKLRIEKLMEEQARAAEAARIASKDITKKIVQ